MGDEHDHVDATGRTICHRWRITRNASTHASFFPKPQVENPTSRCRGQLLGSCLTALLCASSQGPEVMIFFSNAPAVDMVGTLPLGQQKPAKPSNNIPIPQPCAYPCFMQKLGCLISGAKKGEHISQTLVPSTPGSSVTSQGQLACLYLGSTIWRAG